jgi:hypothetical protein
MYFVAWGVPQYSLREAEGVCLLSTLFPSLNPGAAHMQSVFTGVLSTAFDHIYSVSK